MISLLVAAAAAAQAPAATDRKIQDLPGAKIEYYQVSGKSQGEIQRSIASVRPKASDGTPVVAGVKWGVGADVTKRTENNVCTITAVNLKFDATAELPQLKDPRSLDRPVLRSWNSYVEGLEETAAADLWFVHDRLPQVQQALVGVPCDNANAIMDAEIAKLKAAEEQFRQEYSQRVAKRSKR